MLNILLVILAIAAIPVALLLVYTFGSKAQRRRGAVQQAIPPRDGETELDRMIAPLTDAHPDHSGLTLVTDNLEAFRLRLESARRCNRSLDLMYYFWRHDLSGRLLGRELIAAAARGVRVRLLLDDINSFGFDSTYLTLDSHPLIDVRLFNPSRSRTNKFRRGLELIARYFTATRRMHNKCWIADNRLMIAGGRNIGDEYFDASEDSNFRDIDVFGVGPCVAEASAVFDRYWNSDAAIPIRTLNKLRRPNLAKLSARLDVLAHTEHGRTLLDAADQLRRHEHDPMSLAKLNWSCNVEVVADPPEKAAGLASDEWLGRRLLKLLGTAQQSLHIISPYFIPGTDGSRTLIGLDQAGADVRVLTNSLAATDVIAVHGAYSRYRKRLAGSGVAIYELKPDGERRRASLFGSRTASLHTKAFLFDGRTGFVGSFNLDPRSHSINTEMGLLFRCPVLSRQLAAVFDQLTRPEVSFAIGLDDKGLRWSARQSGEEIIYRREPLAPWRRVLPATLIAWLPIESQL